MFHTLRGINWQHQDLRALGGAHNGLSYLVIGSPLSTVRIYNMTTRLSSRQTLLWKETIRDFPRPERGVKPWKWVKTAKV